MKQLITTVLLAMTMVSSIAQTLNVRQGSVTYAFTADGRDMTYSNGGQSLTIGGKTFNVSDISEITVTSEAAVDSNTVAVSYDGTTATVTIAGNIAPYVSATVSGAHVTVAQTNTADIDGDEITYELSGTSADGEFCIASGKYKCTVALAGLTLTNPSGAAISIANSKRIQLSAKKNTVNTLADGTGGEQKASIYSKGQLQLQGNGTLNVTGNTKHAIKSGSYISIKNLTVNITAAVGDGISCEEYFLMKSGTVTISGTGDDGLQCDVDDQQTEATKDHEDEDGGNVYIEGGSLTISTTAAASKGIKADGHMTISEGTLNITTSGKYAYDSDDAEYKSCAALKTDGNMTIDGGTITLKSTGYAGKGIKCDSILTVNGGTLNVTCTGSSSDTYGSAKAIKAGYKVAQSTSSSREEAPGWPGGGGGWPGGGGFPGGHDTAQYDFYGGIVINGGTIIAKASSHEAIESKSTIVINDGIVYAESGDDAINSSSDFTINGGYVMGNSTGNDGLDSNGDFYIKGGNVFAVAVSSPEVGIDANTEGGKKLYITGGNVVAIGGLESGSSLSGVTSKSASFTKGKWYTLKNGTSAAFSFQVPSNSRMASSMTIVATSTPSLTTLSAAPDGTAIWNGYGRK
jgi:hypothetical protein